MTNKRPQQSNTNGELNFVDFIQRHDYLEQATKSLENIEDDLTHNEFTDEHIKTIADTYHAYRGEEGLTAYKDIAGFCMVTTADVIRENGYVLTPGRYVGTEEVEGDGEPFNEKMGRLTAELSAQFDKSEELKEQIKKNLEELGYGF